MATLKVSSTGRFGARYGVRVRKTFLAIESKQKQPALCPCCGALRVKRQNRGIFACKKCGVVFAGGAFLSQTLTGSIVKKMVEQKTFQPVEAGLLKPEELSVSPEKKPEKTIEKEFKTPKSEAGEEAEALMEETNDDI